MKTKNLVCGCSLLAVALSSIPSLEGAALIYEPFDQASGSGSVALGGKAGGTGLSGNWSVNQTVNVVETTTLSYGNLAQSGGQASATAGNGTDAFVTTTGILFDNGLLDNGATLWFSTMFLKTGNGGATNEKGGFAFGTDPLDAAFNGTNMTNSGNGLGFAPIATGLNVATWSGGGNVSTGSGEAYTLGSSVFVVGKIVWGATSGDVETITIYTPDPSDLTTLGTGFTKTMAGVDQTAFDTISFTTRGAGVASDTITYDEIRFGATYADVSPAAVPEPSSAILGALGFLALIHRRR